MHVAPSPSLPQRPSQLISVGVGSVAGEETVNVIRGTVVVVLIVVVTVVGLKVVVVLVTVDVLELVRWRVSVAVRVGVTG